MAKTLTVYLAADLKKFNSGMDKAQAKTNGFSGSLKDKLGPAMIAASAAAGAFALKLATDGVQAAIEDEKAVAQLANTLDNLNLAHDTSNVEAYIYSLERAYGVADTDLRPAYERLVRSTKDTQEANDALKIAMDISASTGKELKTVVDTLGRAYDGSTTSLSRLGVGLDQTQLSAMSVDEIMTVLAKNFSGAADKAANTFEGRLKRLTTATDNLKEAFGAGLLGSLNDATDGTQDMVDTMEDLEPLLKRFGELVGQNVTDLAYLATSLSDAASAAQGLGDEYAILGPVFDNVKGAVERLFNPLGTLAGLLRQVSGEQNTLVDIGGGEFPDAVDDQNFALQAAHRTYQDAAVRLNRLNQEIEVATENTGSNARATGGAARETDKLTKAQEKLIESYELQGVVFQTTKTELIDQIRELENATQAVEDYANSIQQDLLAGFDLLDEYNKAKEGGGNIAQALEEGLKERFEAIEWGGNVLNALKASDVPQSLIEYLASVGPEGGWELGQAMLEDQGLLGSLTEGWKNIQSTTKELALGLVPEFLEAGRLSAIDNLNGLATQFAADQKKFKKLGNKLGQQVGDEFSKRMLKEIADAVREVEAIASAARAEKVEAAQAEQARITEQAVAQAIRGLIVNSDQRAGRNVQPVLQ